MQNNQPRKGESMTMQRNGIGIVSTRGLLSSDESRSGCKNPYKAVASRNTELSQKS